MIIFLSSKLVFVENKKNRIELSCVFIFFNFQRYRPMTIIQIIVYKG